MPDWAELVAFNTTTSYRPTLGHLGQLTVDAGGKVAAVGPGAVLGAADKSGKVAKYVANVDDLGDLAPYRLIVVEAGDLAETWSRTGLDQDGDPISMTGEARREAVARVDRQVGLVLDRLPPETAATGTAERRGGPDGRPGTSGPPGTTVLLGGLSDTTVAAHLHVAIARGVPPAASRTARGYLTAASTRQDGLVTSPT